MQHNLYSTMRSVNIMDGCKSAHFFPHHRTGSGGGGGAAGGGGGSFLNHIGDHLRNKSNRNMSFQPNQNANANACSIDLREALAIYGIPQCALIEPQIEPNLKFVNPVEALANVYKRIESSPECNKSGGYLEQSAVFKGLSDPKLFRKGLRSARQHAVDVHSKVVLSAWLRYERKEDELIGISAMDCCGRSMECPLSALISGYNPESIGDPCLCPRECKEDGDAKFSIMEEEVEECSTPLRNEEEFVDESDLDMSFIIGEEEIRCSRYKIGLLSRPFKAMLYGDFIESRREKINLSKMPLSVRAMRAAEVFSRTKSVDSFDEETVLELLGLANMFCCEEMKSVCNDYLASRIVDLETAMTLIEYGLEETAHLLVAACLQVFLRELPSTIHSPNVMKLFCSLDAKERLVSAGHSSFLLYSFLSQVSMEEDLKSNTTVMLLERLADCASERWQKQLALHQLGCVMLEREEYKDAQKWFREAAEAGHVYSIVGFARAKYKRGHKYRAYKLMNSLISDHAPSGWMYQERSLYCQGIEKASDLKTATILDPTLTYPYKQRAVLMVENDENNLVKAISEINKIIGFKVSPDCLELHAWFLIMMEDYEGALRDVRALLTLNPHYMMFHGKLHGDKLVELLKNHIKPIQQLSLADCWMQLHDRWSCVDDIGCLDVVHHMLSIDPGKSLLRFRQSLLLLRINCHRAAMKSLRMARNCASSEHERLIYEGWVLFYSGFFEEAIAKAEESISIQRSFEAFFLKAFILSEIRRDPEGSAYVIELLEDALRCPSDRLRKGQALSDLAGVYVEVDKLDNAVDCYTNALNMEHARAHQGLARVYHLKNMRKEAYDEMTKLIKKAKFNASAHEKRADYCDREMAKSDLTIASAYEKRADYCDREMAKSDLTEATQLDPLRTYPYRYRAAIMMDNHEEAEAIAELTKAITYKPDFQLLHLRAAFHDSTGDRYSTLRDCEAALCLEPNHTETVELYKRTKQRVDLEQNT